MRNTIPTFAPNPPPEIAKLSDGGGLQLWVTPDGAKRWRLAYRFAGRQKVLAIGVYPAIGLEEARIARQDAKRLPAAALDPSGAKKQAKIEKAQSAANTFEAIAAELVDKKRREGKAEVTVAKAEWLRRGSMSLSPVGRELFAPADTCLVRPDPSNLVHLRRLHSAAGNLAPSAPEVLVHPEAARSREAALTQAMMRCLIKQRTSRNGSELPQPPVGDG